MSMQRIVAGCDVGSATGKVVVLRGAEILSYAVVKSVIKPEKTAYLALEEALRKAGLAQAPARTTR